MELNQFKAKKKQKKQKQKQSKKNQKTETKTNQKTKKTWKGFEKLPQLIKHSGNWYFFYCIKQQTFQSRHMDLSMCYNQQILKH